ncbi:MAG: methyltransferase domain-containing protein [Burkholderiaceae bacterium]|nr:methyltransferase domain-containing protein [Burkholderiaceae bacterium]
MPSSTDWYDNNAPAISRTYESLEADRLNAWMADLLPTVRGAALDVGAGSGRDAAWLAHRGLDVVAVQPSNSMREQALSLHPSAPVRWLRDALPGPARGAPRRPGLRRDPAVCRLMHVAPADRARAFRKLVSLM